MSKKGKKYIVNIMAHNEEETIKDSISAILGQRVEIESTLEIHVFANACTDNTENIVQDLAAVNNNIILHSIAKKGKANALRECISYFKEAGHPDIIESKDRLFFIDADILIPENNLLSNLSNKLDVSDDLYLVSALPVPESLYNQKKDFVSELFRIRYYLQYSFKKNLVRGACHVVRWSVLKRLELPEDLLSTDMFLECKLDGHFLMDHDLQIIIKLKTELSLEIKRDLLHQIGREQVYHWRRQGLLPRLDRDRALPDCFLSPLDPKEYLWYLIRKAKLKPIIILSFWMIIFKYNKYRAGRIFLESRNEGANLIDYWSTKR